MSSEVKANKWSPGTGVAGTLGDSGDTFTVPSGATLAVASGATITNSGTATGFGGDNTPAFMVNRITTVQAIPYDTVTKIEFNGETYDPDNVFDSTTNYRFTVPAGEGGNYFLFWTIFLESLTNANLLRTQMYCRVNGTDEVYHSNYYANSPIRWATNSDQAILALSAADYVEIWIHHDTSNGAAGQTGYSNSYINTGFGGFKLL